MGWWGLCVYKKSLPIYEIFFRVDSNIHLICYNPLRFFLFPMAHFFLGMHEGSQEGCRPERAVRVQWQKMFPFPGNFVVLTLF